MRDGNDKNKSAPPPVLTRRRLRLQMKKLRPSFPAELIEAASEEIIKAMAGALASGRPIALRGFGRFQPRRYHGASKRLGLIFRPSPELSARINKPGNEDL